MLLLHISGLIRESHYITLESIRCHLHYADIFLYCEGSASLLQLQYELRYADIHLLPAGMGVVSRTLLDKYIHIWIRQNPMQSSVIN